MLLRDCPQEKRNLLKKCKRNSVKNKKLLLLQLLLLLHLLLLLYFYYYFYYSKNFKIQTNFFIFSKIASKQNVTYIFQTVVKIFAK